MLVPLDESSGYVDTLGPSTPLRSACVSPPMPKSTCPVFIAAFRDAASGITLNRKRLNQMFFASMKSGFLLSVEPSPCRYFSWMYGPGPITFVL